MRLVITEKAEKDLADLDTATSQRIRTALKSMSNNPGNSDVKKLKGVKNLWRLRVGDFRVLLRIEGKKITVYALRVKHRREAYDW